MATYTISHTLQNSTAYPAAVFSNSFAPLTSVYFKLGDTIQATVSHPISGNTLGISLNDVNEANPDPSNLGGTFTHADDYTYSLTWSGTFAEGGTASTDFFTQWFHFNRTGTFQYSAKSVFRRVSVASLSMGDTTIAPGGNTTITANTIQGLLPASGTLGHRLYTYVTDSSGNVITTSGTNGMTFSTVLGSNNWLGTFTTTQTTNILTVGSGVSAGSYTLHVGHYGGGGSGNNFYGSDHRITSTPFTVATVASDSTPDAFNLGSDLSTVNLNAQIQASQITVSGIDVASPISVSGQGSPRYSVAGGAYTSSSGSVTNGQTVDFRFDASGSYATSHTATLNIGGVTDSVTATTLSNPGSGGSTGGAGTGGTYGLEVRNSSNTIVFGPNLRSSHVIRASGSTSNSGTAQISAGGTLTVGPIEGLTSTNTSTIAIVALAESTSGYGSYQITVTRGSVANGIGEGNFRITNPSSVALNVTHFVVRY